MMKNIIDQKNIYSDFMGEIILNENLGKLLEQFDKVFLNMAKSIGGIEEYYPVLLTLDTLEKTGYLKHSPHQCIICNNYITSGERQYALSPSACFHVYEHYENCELDQMKVITLKQNVFRAEDEKWDEIGKIRDYHVREIVFIGNSEFVDKMRQIMMDKTVKFISSLKLNFNLDLATDSFILPEMKRYEKIQLLKKSKYELSVNIQQKNMALASFNIHEESFSKPFHIVVQGEEQTVTGCVGFGLERWVFAIISEFGYDPAFWPNILYGG